MIKNPEAAFTLFNDSSSPERVRWLLLIFSLVAAVAVLAALVKLGRRITATSLGLALILGGALGNAYDRLRFGYVIDFSKYTSFTTTGRNSMLPTPRLWWAVSCCSTMPCSPEKNSLR